MFPELFPGSVTLLTIHPHSKTLYLLSRQCLLISSLPLLWNCDSYLWNLGSVNECHPYLHLLVQLSSCSGFSPRSLLIYYHFQIKDTPLCLRGQRNWPPALGSQLLILSPNSSLLSPGIVCNYILPQRKKKICKRKQK